MADVVIPARNEAATIGQIVASFHDHPNINRVIVVVDADTNDGTEIVANYNGATNVCRHNYIGGKGQLVKHGLTHVYTKRVIFCDADIYGLTHDHITQLTSPHADEMIIGVPDFPDTSTVPRRFEDTITWAWPWVSGQRSILTNTARKVNLHGYLMEVQLNAANHHTGKGHRFERLHGLKSPTDFSERRLMEMERDRQWGIQNGVL